jgi:hypothetical protein
MRYVITERRERLGASKEKIFDILLTSSVPNSPPKRLTVSKEDWQTFAVGDDVGYDGGKLWHKELPDQPVEAKE